MRLRRSRSHLTTVAVINGWTIEREIIGAGTVWHANACDAAGYRIQDETFGRRRDAITWAEQHTVPPAKDPSPEVLALRQKNETAMAEYYRRRG